MSTKGKKTDVIKMGLPLHWRNLHPGLQHSLAGDLVLSNQFDSLVGMDNRGVIVPIGAKSWSINDDFTEFTFKIDTAKQFSDGSNLKAEDFKRAWETSLSLEPISSNNSLLDVLYKIRGFSDFSNTRHLSGVEVLSPETLRVHFSTPFRMALNHLTGNRFAAFKEVSGKYIGTGNYIVTEVNKDQLLLTTNPFSRAHIPIQLNFIPPDKIGSAIVNGAIDCIPYIQGTMIDKSFQSKDVELTPGQEASHMALNLNNLPGRIFHKKEYRLALQALTWKKIRGGELTDMYGEYFQYDPQIYMDVQVGRVQSESVDELIKLGEPWINSLIEETRRHPILVYSHEGARRTFDLFSRLGLAISTKSSVVDQKTFLDNVYRDFEPDVLIGAFSIANGDPDGIYHRLGRNGAILSPMSFSESVAKLLEDGRKIINLTKIDEHYQKVALEVLKNVPFVHLGFSKAVMAYRKDRIIFEGITLKRNEGHLDVFELK